MMNLYVRIYVRINSKKKSHQRHPIEKISGSEGCKVHSKYKLKLHWSLKEFPSRWYLNFVLASQRDKL